MTTNRQHRRRAAIVTLALLMAPGCTGYEGASPAAFQYAKAMYGIANRRSASQLDSFAEQVESASAAGELTDRETGWLNAMLEDARAEKWGAAAKASRRLMTDQRQ